MMQEALRVIELTEASNTEVTDLTADECDHLIEQIEGISIQRKPYTENTYIINPNNLVGTIRAGNLEVRLKPKLPISSVYFLLLYPGIRKSVFRDDFVLSKNADELHEVIARSFARLADNATQEILQAYQQREETLMGVKGRIRLADQFGKHGRISIPLEVSYDDLTSDIVENQLVLAAARRLLPLKKVEEETLLLLREVIRRLPEVKLVNFDRTDLPYVPITRLNQRYESVMELSRLILSNQVVEFGSGGVWSESMIFPMWTVFENFVHAALSDELGLNTKNFPKNSPNNGLFLDGPKGESIPLKPDLSWWEGDRCVFVGDVKYKRDFLLKGEQADLYQLLAYTIAAEVKDGFLIYAHTKASQKIAHHEISRSGKNLHILALDISGSPKQIMKNLAEIANLISRSVHISSNAK
tara:strand:- start:122 stop:1363 length:1242 start_codon:yes stop_codon:yes gene_type:complete